MSVSKARADRKLNRGVRITGAPREIGDEWNLRCTGCGWGTGSPQWYDARYCPKCSGVLVDDLGEER